MGSILPRVAMTGPSRFGKVPLASCAFFTRGILELFVTLPGRRMARILFPVVTMVQCRYGHQNDSCALFVLSQREACMLTSKVQHDDRRVLGEHEQANIWQLVQDRWGITPKMHWYPLSD